MRFLQPHWDFSVSVKPKTGGGYEAFAFEGLPGKSKAVAKEHLESLDYAQLGNALKGIQLYISKLKH